MGAGAVAADTAVSDVVALDAWLEGEGFLSPWARVQARAALEAAGLSRPGKQGMAAAKVERARAALAAGLFRVCADADCAALAAGRADGRLVTEVAPGGCQVCGGSDNRRAALAMAAACARGGVRRILVVGGTGALHAELAGLLAGTAVTLRCIDGSERTPTKKDALRDLAWAEFMVVWASTPLPHKVSVSYTDERPPGLPWVTVARRGIAALCSEVRRSLEGGGRARGARPEA